jgi:DNA-binding transcriptional regulator YiaG
MKHRTNADLRAFLREMDISQADFARVIETDHMAVNRWATGKTRAPGSAWTLIDLVRARPEIWQVLLDVRGLRK